MLMLLFHRTSIKHIKTAQCEKLHTIHNLPAQHIKI